MTTELSNRVERRIRAEWPGTRVLPNGGVHTYPEVREGGSTDAIIKLMVEIIDAESAPEARLDRIESAISLAFEGEGEAWSDKLSGDRLARVARDAIESAGLIR